MKRTIALIFMLTGCITSRIETGLNAMMGAPVSDLIARLGYPEGERHIAGAHLYIWSNSQCRIQVSVDGNDRVASWQAQGRKIACSEYARALSR